MIPNVKVSTVFQALSSAATTTNASSVTKGTATDLLLVVDLENYGGTSLAGSWSFQLQGSNDGSTWTNVSPDKGSLPSAQTAAGKNIAHYAQLQYADYRVQEVTTTTTTGSVATTYSFYNLQDSVDDSVA